jgi:hypothetical protein
MQGLSARRAEPCSQVEWTKRYKGRLRLVAVAVSPLKVKHYPLSNLARAALLIGLILNIFVWLTVAYYYPTLPMQDSSAFFIIPAIFTLIFVFFLMVLRFRYTLLEKYPYLINMPSFVYRLGMAKDPETEGKIISRVFIIHSLAALYISVLEVVITYSVLPINGMRNVQILLPSILIVIAVFVITVFALYRNIYISFAKKVRRGRQRT